MSLKSILITYLIGGITLPPLLILALLYIIYNTAPTFVDADDEKDDDLSDFDSKEYHSLSLTQLEESSTSGTKAYKTGWITVTKEYHGFVPNDKENSMERKDSTNKSAYTALYRLVKNNTKKDNKDGQTTETDISQQSSPTTSTSSQTVISKTVKKKNRFFAVLRHGNLFLYKSEEQKDVQHVIVLSNHIVTIWPRNLRDGELFTKKTAISLLKRQAKKKSDTPPKSSAASLNDKETIESTFDMLDKGIIPPNGMGFFIYCDTNYEKEDWYFELIKVTKRENFEPSGNELDQLEPSVFANALHFKTADMISLIQTLHSSEGQLQTRWLNAVIGRIFLAVQSTDFFENVVETKLLKKLAKINRPGFLEEFQVKKIEIGNAAPVISFPKLESLNPDGSLRVSFNFTYTGKLSLQVATKANISLGGAFKSREVGILLAVTVNKLEGPLVISVKPPPSSRIWYTFEKMPELDLTIEPVVSQRQITYGMITKVIENKFRNAIRESLVEPYWDDISFFDTSDEFYRGGIWDTKKRPQQDTSVDDNEKNALDEFEEETLNPGDENEELLYSDLLSPTGNQLGNDPMLSPGDGSSVRSLKPKTSFSSINSFGKKKTDAVVATSDEQFLADGSYVARDQLISNDTASDGDTSVGTSRSSTMQILSDETAAGKKALTTGMKKISRWYNEKSKSGQSKNDKRYNPPEMISRRRAPSNTSEKDGLPGSVSRKDALENHKNAPQPHSFPAEYLYGLDTHTPDSETSTKVMPPTKIADMKSPYSPAESRFSPIDTSLSSPSELSDSTPSLQKKPSIPRRKPVSEDTAIQGLGIAMTTTDSIPSILVEPSTSTPPKLPSRSPPPQLPPREGSIEVTSTVSVKRVPPPLPLRDLSTGGDADISSETVESIIASSDIDYPVLPQRLSGSPVTTTVVNTAEAADTADTADTADVVVDVADAASEALDEHSIDFKSDVTNDAVDEEIERS